MKVIRVFNNNIVSTMMDDQKEAIVQGSGIGFQKKPGDSIDAKKIERVYYIRDEHKAKFHDLLDETPIEYFQIAEMIMRRVQEVLNVELSGQIIIALTDHIHFAVQRQKEGIYLPNLLTGEIRALYKEEYNIALWALKVIRDFTGVQLPEDEAGYIALHIVNAYMNIGTENTANTVILTKGIPDIIKETLHVEFEEDSLDYTRFLLHLKFLARRIFNNQTDELLNMDDIYTALLAKDSRMNETLAKIHKFVEKKFSYSLSRNEELYLMVHLLKIMQKN